MAITRAAAQVTWSAANTLSVTSATAVTSDVFTLDATCVGFAVQVHADNAGTPASGDTAVWRVLWSTGDVITGGGDDYDTAEHGEFLVTLDTYATNTPGEDPAIRTVWLPPVAQKFKLQCVCANAATRNVTISARVEEMRAA